jgi:hypothetical protein
MGGGGLRILGHKKWHVWRRDNIERVLRDEREHAEQQRRERDEQRRRDQEVRADALGQAHAQPPSSAISHINFFEKEEEAHTLALLSGGDRAEPRKRRREQQPSESLGRQARLPWYATATTHEDEANSRHGHKRKR